MMWDQCLALIINKDNEIYAIIIINEHFKINKSVSESYFHEDQSV